MGFSLYLKGKKLFEEKYFYIKFESGFVFMNYYNEDWEVIIEILRI